MTGTNADAIPPIAAKVVPAKWALSGLCAQARSRSEEQNDASDEYEGLEHHDAALGSASPIRTYCDGPGFSERWTERDLNPRLRACKARDLPG